MGGSVENNPFAPPSAGGGTGPAGLDAFLEQLQQTNPRFFDIGNSLLDAGTSTGDDPLTAAQRSQGLEMTRGALARQGVKGSPALNQLARTNMGFDQQALRRKQGFLEQGAQFAGTGLQNLLAEPTLDVARTAAQNAGQGGGGGKGKG